MECLLTARTIDSRSGSDHRLCIPPPGCEEAILCAVRRNIAIDDVASGVDMARMLGFNGASRSTKGLVSEQMAAVVSEG